MSPADDWQPVEDWKPITPPSSLVDAARSIPGGLTKGALGTLDMVRGTLSLPGDLAQSAGYPQLNENKAANIKAVESGNLTLPGTMMGLAGPGLTDMVSRAIGGFYQPKTRAGRYAETLSSFAPAALAPSGAESTAGQIAQRLARVAVPGTLSEAGGENFGDIGRLGGAVLGGALTEGVPAMADVGARALNRGYAALGKQEFLDPEKVAVQRLQANTSPQAGQNLDAWHGASNPTLLDVGGNATRRLVRAAAGGEGEPQNTAQAYADRVAANLQGNTGQLARALTPPTAPPQSPSVAPPINDLQGQHGAMMNSLATEAMQNVQPKASAPEIPEPNPQSSAETFLGALKDKRDALASSQYPEPYSKPAAVTPEMVDALQGKEGRAAIGRALSNASINRDKQTMGELQDLQDVATRQSGGRDPITGRMRSMSGALSELSAGSLDKVRIAMRDLGSEASKAGNNTAAKGWFGRMNDIDTALDQTPGLKEARATFRNLSQQIEAVPVGQSATHNPVSEAVTAMSPESRAASGVGYRDSIVAGINHPTAGATGFLNRLANSTEQTDNLAAHYGQPAGSQFQQGIANEIARINNARFITPSSGSQTAGRLQDSGLLSLIPTSKAGLIAHAMDALRNGLTLTESQRQAIVRLGTSESDVRRLIQSPQVPARSLARQLAVPAALSNQQASP